jgi:carboxyl-terminal processing protease
MPRRNLYLLLAAAALSIACYQELGNARRSRYGRIVLSAMDRIDRRYLEKIDSETLLEGALEGMMGRLDEHSAYIGPAEYGEFRETLDQEFGGIGIEIALDPDTRQLTVVSPLVGTPAYEAGILAGDRILRIDGASTKGFTIPDASKRLRGKEGERVVLQILRHGEKEPLDIELKRAVIKVATVLGDTRGADGDWNFFLQGHDRIGYLRITLFSERTLDELKTALARLDRDGMKALILDLRNNPGGLLNAATETCDLFIESGLIVSIRGRDQRIREKFEARAEGTYRDFPLVVLVNKYSASASEIVAACLEDHQRAQIVGERTFGKGTVQEILPLEELDGQPEAIKLTTASYWRPSGKNIHRHKDAKETDDWGVLPSKGCEVKLSADEFKRVVQERQTRDQVRPNGAAKGAKPAPSPFDPQLTKAVECVEKALAPAGE